MRTLVLALALASTAAAAQSTVSLVMKAGGANEFGLEVGGERLSARALTAFATDFEDSSVRLDLAALYRTNGRGPLATRVGLTTTILDFEDAALFGVLFGADYALSRRFAVFGEVVLDADFGDGIGVVSSARNTGVGVRLRL